MTPAARDVLNRAGKTFVQSFLPSAAYLYSHAHSISSPWPVLASGAVAGGASAVSVLWNGSTALLGARRAKKAAAYVKQLEDLDKLVKTAIAADRAQRPYQDGHPSTP